MTYTPFTATEMLAEMRSIHRTLSYYLDGQVQRGKLTPQAKEIKLQKVLQIIKTLEAKQQEEYRASQVVTGNWPDGTRHHRHEND